MALRIPPLFPNRQDLGGTPHLEKRTYSLSGIAETYGGNAIEAVYIKIVGRLSNIETGSTHTDANGRFKATVPENEGGYRIKAIKNEFGFSPAFYDALGHESAIRFSGQFSGKGPDDPRKTGKGG